MTERPRHVESDISAENLLRARRLGIETLHEAVVFMRADCPVCGRAVALGRRVDL